MCSTSGNSSRMISRARRSWAGFTKQNRNITAIDSPPSWLQPADAGPHRVLVEGQQHLALEVDGARGSGCGPGAGRSASGAG